jgi:hypothetical protein
MGRHAVRRFPELISNLLGVDVGDHVLKHDRIEGQPQRHDSAADSGEPEVPAVQKKPFVEPTLSQSVSLPDVTAGSFVGTISF